MGQLCDAGCIATFTKSRANISHHGKSILQASRHPTTNLWHLDPFTPSAPSSTPSVNAALGQPNAAARMKFYHAALFCPPLSTLQHAIRTGFLSSFPGLHLQTLRRQPPISEATIKGHLNAHRRNHRSTRNIVSTPNYVFNATTSTPSRTHHVYADCFDITGKIFTDQTGPFLLPSISGNKYVFILMTTTAIILQLEPFLPGQKNILSPPIVPSSPFSFSVGSVPAFND